MFSVDSIHCVKIYQPFIVFDDVRDESSIRPLHYDVDIFLSWILIIILLKVQIHDREKRWKKLPWGGFKFKGVQVLQHVGEAREGKGKVWKNFV